MALANDNIKTMVIAVPQHSSIKYIKQAIKTANKSNTSTLLQPMVTHKKLDAYFTQTY